ncbi:MAG: ammonia channel protein, partial [Chthoniobacteraceae bacterium]
MKIHSSLPRGMRALVPLFCLALTTTAFAQEAAAAPKIDTGDNAWMLASSALVLMMTGPGLALFYGGLVRGKNVLATMMQSMFLMSFVSILWFLYGYSACFAEGNAFVGSFTQFAFLQGVGGAPNADYAATIPHQTFMLYQMMFA